MGHSLVFGRSYSLVLDLRLTGERSKGMYSNCDLMHGIGSKSQRFGKVRIGGELTLHHVFKRGKSRFQMAQFRHMYATP